MLIFSKKMVVDVDSTGKKIVINILVEPPMYPPYENPKSANRLSFLRNSRRDAKRKDFACFLIQMVDFIVLSLIDIMYFSSKRRPLEGHIVQLELRLGVRYWA